MKSIFSELAKHELDDATNYYKMEFEGRGIRFREDVKKAIMRILEYPEA